MKELYLSRYTEDKGISCKEREYWLNYWWKCCRASGDHILVGGQTGSGKTQLLYMILREIRYIHPDEKVIWFDTGKASEILVLAERYSIKVFYPAGKTIEISDLKKEIHPIEYYPFVDTLEILQNLSDDKINVISIEPYFPEPKEYTKILADFFKDLLNEAMDYHLPVPLAIFIDEIQYIAPGQGQALNKKHADAAVHMQRNIERLRALEVRIVGGSQDWTKLRRGVRQAFSWIIIKRGMTFTARDVPQLAKHNNKFWRLSTNECLIVYPSKFFAPCYYVTPFFGKGKDVGMVRYYQKKDNGSYRHPQESVSKSIYEGQKIENEVRS